jgi:hypothetical protein
MIHSTLVAPINMPTILLRLPEICATKVNSELNITAFRSLVGCIGTGCCITGESWDEITATASGTAAAGSASRYRIMVV